MKDTSISALPWYAPVFAAYPLLYIAAANPGQVDASPAAVAVGIALVAATLVVAACRLVMPSWSLAGVGAAWIVFMFYAYGPANEWWLDFVTAGLEQRAVGETWFNAHPQLIHSLVWLLLIALGLGQLRRIRLGAVPRLTRGLNVVAALLAILVALQSLRNFASAGDAAPLAAVTTPAGTTLPAAPDIYVIVLDGYARADILREYYGFDNNAFINRLRARGFQVSDESRANFSWTFLSLGSTLNLDYMQPLLGKRLDPASRSRRDTYELLRDNRASRFLRERGYRYVHLQSTWGGTGTNPHADEFISCETGLFNNEYSRAVADASWLRALSSRLSLDVANCHLRNLETLAEQPRRPGPKFVLAHFLPPHHPYLFDREGNILRRANLSDQFEFQKRLWEDRQSYVDQLVYMNGRIGNLVEGLIEHSTRPPVILLLSDHGPNLKAGLSLPEQRRIRFANFTAMYLPGAPPGLLPPDATPVNHLRRVFNFYFKAGFPLLEDRYFASSYALPFRFEEIDGEGDSLHEAATF